MQQNPKLYHKRLLNYFNTWDVSQTHQVSHAISLWAGIPKYSWTCRYSNKARCLVEPIAKLSEYGVAIRPVSNHVIAPSWPIQVTQAIREWHIILPVIYIVSWRSEFFNSGDIGFLIYSSSCSISQKMHIC